MYMGNNEETRIDRGGECRSPEQSDGLKASGKVRIGRIEMGSRQHEMAPRLRSCNISKEGTTNPVFKGRQFGIVVLCMERRDVCAYDHLNVHIEGNSTHHFLAFRSVVELSKSDTSPRRQLKHKENAVY